jgi:hypothetical protein
VIKNPDKECESIHRNPASVNVQYTFQPSGLLSLGAKAVTTALKLAPEAHRFGFLFHIKRAVSILRVRGILEQVRYKGGGRGGEDGAYVLGDFG